MVGPRSGLLPLPGRHAEEGLSTEKVRHVPGTCVHHSPRDLQSITRGPGALLRQGSSLPSRAIGKAQAPEHLP